MKNLFRDLPSIESLKTDERLADLPSELVVRAARSYLDELRGEIRAGAINELPCCVAGVRRVAEELGRSRLRRVVNATGTVLHTNLGRAPLPEEAVKAVVEVARGYSNLELDLSSGKRGGRLDGVRDALRQLTGCEDAVVVNNNAAAVMLVLAAHASGREVVVSRGEQVEIGGSFRVPDVLALSGAKMVEVGTTNRTRAGDYAEAIGPDTAMLLRVHPSNFRIEGFTERPTVEELAKLGVPLVDDLGSGAISEIHGEPAVEGVLKAGATAVTFSGDKLLGGAQAGVIAGSAEFVERCRRHPLYRAMRLDKLALVAFEATLRLYLAGGRERVPVVRMLESDFDDEAARLAEALQGVGVEARVIESSGLPGGGSLPGVELPSKVVEVGGVDPEALAAVLRLQSPPIVGRIQRERLLLDPRTLLPGDLEEVVSGVGVAFSALTGK